MEILRRGRFGLTPYTFENPTIWQFKEARDLVLRRIGRRNTVWTCYVCVSELYPFGTPSPFVHSFNLPFLFISGWWIPRLTFLWHFFLPPFVLGQLGLSVSIISMYHTYAFTSDNKYTCPFLKTCPEIRTSLLWLWQTISNFQYLPQLV